MKFIRILIYSVALLFSIILFRDSIYTNILLYKILTGSLCFFTLLKLIHFIFPSFRLLVPNISVPTHISYFSLFYIKSFTHYETNTAYIIITIVILQTLVSILSSYYYVQIFHNICYGLLTAILFKLFNSSEDLMFRNFLLILNLIAFGRVAISALLRYFPGRTLFNYIFYIIQAIMTILFIIIKVKAPETSLFYIIASGIALFSNIIYKFLDYQYDMNLDGLSDDWYLYVPF